MGVGASKNESTFDVINQTLSENINKQLVKIAQRSVSTINATQFIKIIAKAGRDANISNVKQKMVMNIDIKKFIDNVDETTLKSIMTTSLEASAKDSQTVNHQLILGASLSSNSSKASVMNSAINRVVNSYTHEQFIEDVQNVLGSQTIEIPVEAGRDVNVSDISQYVQVELLSSHISKAMAKTIMDVSTESSTTAKKETSQSASGGLSMGMITIIIIVVIIALLGGFALFWFNGGREIVVQQLDKAGGTAKMRPRMTTTPTKFAMLARHSQYQSP